MDRLRKAMAAFVAESEPSKRRRTPQACDSTPLFAAKTGLAQQRGESP
jgi:hypothetical protein